MKCARRSPEIPGIGNKSDYVYRYIPYTLHNTKRTMVDVLTNLKSAYIVLCDRVKIALRTQLGDEARLNHHIDEVASYANAVEMVQVFLFIYAVLY